MLPPSETHCSNLPLPFIHDHCAFLNFPEGRYMILYEEIDESEVELVSTLYNFFLRHCSGGKISQCVCLKPFIPSCHCLQVILSLALQQDMVKFLQFGGLLKKILAKTHQLTQTVRHQQRKKGFEISKQGVNFTKLFSSSQTPWQNKLQCFSLQVFVLSLIFAIKTQAYLSEAFLGSPS